MEWNTPVSIDLQQGAVTHHHRMMLFGSCFAEHIGTRLGEFHFRVDVNPFGSCFPMKTFFQTEIYGTVLPIIRAFHI